MSTTELERCLRWHRGLGRRGRSLGFGPALWLIVVLGTCGGCTSLFGGKTEQAESEAKLRDLMKPPEPPDLIRDGTMVQGLRPVTVEGVGVVNGLPGTGGAPDPSMFRDQLVEEMKRNDVADPNQFLEMDETAMVRVITSIPPGARRGDPLDIRVMAPKEASAQDLHGGWLLDTRLREQRLLQNVVRQSDVMAIAMGSVLTRADFEPSADDALRLEGQVLAGGRVQTTRKLGLMLRPKYQHAKMAKAIADAVNRRFFFFDGTTRRGIATAIEDDFVEVEVHPRYRYNVSRMMRVVQAIGVKPGMSDSQERLAELADRLRNPVTAADA
jgi:flagellar basal body P-ring protein FlgI